jgi:SOS-response transcriptional repressor LexA
MADPWNRGAEVTKKKPAKKAIKSIEPVATENTKPITDRQQELLRVIEKLMAEHKRPPSVREIAAAMDIKSPNGVMNHLRALVKKGYVAKERTSRSIRLVHATVCPCCGRPFP